MRLMANVVDMESVQHYFKDGHGILCTPLYSIVVERERE